MNASFSHRSPSSRWLLAGLVALLGFGFAAPARAADDPAAGNPVVIVAPDPTPAPAPVVTVGATGTDSYIKGGDTTSSAPAATSPDSYIKG